MKKVIKQLSLVAALMFMKQLAFAQVESAPVNLTVDLSASVISLSLGASPNVEFAYTTAADYTATKTVSKAAHLSVVSNRTYSIAVKATAFTATSGNLPLSTVSVTVDPLTLNGGTATPVNLGTTNSTLLTGGIPSNSAVFDIIYSISSPASLLTLPRELYTSTVTYTATHQ